MKQQIPRKNPHHKNLTPRNIKFEKTDWTKAKKLRIDVPELCRIALRKAIEGVELEKI